MYRSSLTAILAALALAAPASAYHTDRPVPVSPLVNAQINLAFAIPENVVVEAPPRKCWPHGRHQWRCKVIARADSRTCRSVVTLRKDTPTGWYFPKSLFECPKAWRPVW